MPGRSPPGCTSILWLISNVPRKCSILRVSPDQDQSQKSQISLENISLREFHQTKTNPKNQRFPPPSPKSSIFRASRDQNQSKKSEVSLENITFLRVSPDQNRSPDSEIHFYRKYSIFRVSPDKHQSQKSKITPEITASWKSRRDTRGGLVCLLCRVTVFACEQIRGTTVRGRNYNTCPSLLDACLI